MDDSPEAWSAVTRAPFVSLGTYRKTGVVVRTPVWIARDGDKLVVTTGGSTGKVKRLRRDDRVTLQPCSRSGEIDSGAPLVHGHARIIGPDADRSSAIRALRAKYSLQFVLIFGLGRLTRFLRRKPDESVILRISRAT